MASRLTSRFVLEGVPAPRFRTAAETAVSDHLPKARRFEFVPLWQIAVFFVYVMRRVDCRHCKRIVVEQVPWSDGKHQTTLTYRWFLAEWGRRLSWSETATNFRTSWQKVFHSVRYAVMWRIAHNSWENVTAIGIDEIDFQPSQGNSPISGGCTAGIEISGSSLRNDQINSRAR